MRYLCNNRSLCRSEYETLGTPIKSALVYMITALIKLICLATFLEVSESDSFDPYQKITNMPLYMSHQMKRLFRLTDPIKNHFTQAAKRETERWEKDRFCVGLCTTINIYKKVNTGLPWLASCSFTLKSQFC